MSSELPAAPSAGPWPPLDTHERRVLGVLVEKAKTTPDAYPLSVNALVTGANQKSNRDPVLRPLVERNLVVYLTPEGRGAVVTHGFHPPDDLDRLRARAHAQPAEEVEAKRPPPPGPALEDDLTRVRGQIASLQQAVEELR